MRTELLFDHVAHRAAVRLQDPGIGQHGLEAHALAAGQRMVHRRDHRQRFVADRAKNVLTVRQSHHAADHHVQPAFVHAADQQIAGAGGDFHRQQRIGLLQAQQGVGQVAGRGRHDAADEQLARAAQAQFLQFAGQGRDRPAHAPEISHHAFAGRGQRQAAADPSVQRLADGQLQFVQHLAGGGLGHVELAGGRAQRTALFDRQQQDDLPHAQPGQQGGDVDGAFHD
ncbi:hypothetical protein D9M70_523430 [compost metagenome]